MTTAADIRFVEMRIAKVVGFSGAEDHLVSVRCLAGGGGRAAASHRDRPAGGVQPGCAPGRDRVAPSDDLSVRRWAGAGPWWAGPAVRIDRLGPVQPQVADRVRAEMHALPTAVAIPGGQLGNPWQGSGPNHSASAACPPPASAAPSTASTPSSRRLPSRSRYQPAAPTCSSRSGRHTNSSTWPS
jgi:hypothetical protein